MLSSKPPEPTIPLLTSPSSCREWKQRVLPQIVGRVPAHHGSPTSGTSQLHPPFEASERYDGRIDICQHGTGDARRAHNKKSDRERRCRWREGVALQGSQANELVSCRKACEGSDKILTELNRLHVVVLRSVVTVIISL